MRTSGLCLVVALTGLLFTASARAETKVTLSKMHLCCGGCYEAVSAAVADVEGASVAYDKEAKTATLTAKDDKTAQKALDAIAAAGFHGKSDNEKIAMHKDSGAEKGKVTRLELTGIHNCCGACNRAVVKAIESVDGTAGNTAKAKSRTLVVEGNFDALALISALYDAGFHVKVKK